MAQPQPWPSMPPPRRPTLTLVVSDDERERLLARLREGLWKVLQQRL